MSAIFFLIPVAVGLGLLALAAFFWTVRSGQYDDLKGAKNRILGADDRPLNVDTDADSSAGASTSPRTRQLSS